MRSQYNAVYRIAIVCLLAAGIVIFFPVRLSLAQTTGNQGISVKCGDIVDGEFTKTEDTVSFLISSNPGDTLNISAKAIGDALKFNYSLLGPTGLPVVPFKDEVEKAITLKSGVLSARGTYTIQFRNGYYYQGWHPTGGVGVFTLYVGCTLRDGTVINPGDKPAGDKPSGDKASSDVAASGSAGAVPFTGVGFPGLPSVDFSNAVTVSLQASGSDGKLPPNGNTVLGYTFVGKSGNKVDLSFARTAGNLNLGLVVLSAQNKVVFQASLVNTTALTAQFTLPADGDYTIGIFKIDLLPPDKPEATAFKVGAQVK